MSTMYIFAAALRIVRKKTLFHQAVDIREGAHSEHADDAVDRALTITEDQHPPLRLRQLGTVTCQHVFGKRGLVQLHNVHCLLKTTGTLEEGGDSAITKLSQFQF